MASAADSLPTDLAAAHAMILETRAALLGAEARASALVREKLSCRSCESITQPPAPSHPIERGRAGAMLLAHVLFAKYGLHLPLNRQSAAYAREGIDLSVSTLADWVGACAATLLPMVL